MYASSQREGVMDRRRPFGLDGVPPSQGGIAPYAGARSPGPIHADHGPGAIESAVHSPAATSDTSVDAALNLPFAVDHEYYRLRRVDTALRRGFSEVPVAADQAVAIVERAIGQHTSNQSLLRLLETAIAQLAGVHERGLYILLWLRPEAPRAPAMGASPAPRTPAPGAPVASRSIRMEEPMIPPVQATVLMDAARTGAPFCEVCARAAAQ
jgi:hypothetical protein